MTLLERLIKSEGPSRAAFIEYFLDRAFPEPNSGCWFWVGTSSTDKRSGRQRPIFSLQGSYILAHRASAALYNLGPIGDGFVCHHCDEPMCVNPDHLYVGDHASNMADMKRRKRAGFYSNPEKYRRHGRAVGKANTHFRGVGNPKAKLTPDQVLAIRSSKEKTKTLAERYGVNRSNIQRIRSGKQWSALRARQQESGSE